MYKVFLAKYMYYCRISEMGLADNLQWTAAKLMSVSKFAVDSAVSESLKGGMQAYAIVKGKLKGLTPLTHANRNKQQSFVVVEEMQAKLEKMQGDMDDIEQRSMISTLRREGQEHSTQLDDNEPVKCSLPEVTTRGKTLIRSRL